MSVFPMNAPHYAVYFMLDEPHGNKSTGGYSTAGAVSAPAAGRVIARIAPMLGLLPDTATWRRSRRSSHPAAAGPWYVSPRAADSAARRHPPPVALAPPAPPARAGDVRPAMAGRPRPAPGADAPRRAWLAGAGAPRGQLGTRCGSLTCCASRDRGPGRAAVP